MMKTNLIDLKNFCERRAVKIFFLRLFAFWVLLLLCAAYNSAQTSSVNRQTKKKVSQTKPKISKDATEAAHKEVTNKDATVSSGNTAVTVVNRTETDYLSGEANVSVNPKQPTVIRLGLAQNATSVVEFPMVDQIYYIHEGNPRLVTVFQSPTKQTDRSITLYPGEGFLPAPVGQKELSVTITMQMKSGLVIVLEIVPAPDIRQNAHRCVLNYNTTEVVAARRAAGLKVNLGDENLGEQGTQTRAVSTLVNANMAKESRVSESETVSPSPSSIEIAVGASNNPDSAKRKMKTSAEISRLVNKRLAEAIKSSNQNLTIWSPATFGLSLSTSKVMEIDGLQRMIIIAVKNEMPDALRLLDEMPELQIKTVDKAGNSLQIEQLTRKYVETTSLNGTIPAGAICYYAIVYDNPVLGANQKLLVSAAHDRAADTPAIATTNKMEER